jgi:predicted phage terminase large subunit-like protein
MRTRPEANAAYRQTRTDADLRALYLGDLFFLLLCGLGRKDINHDWLYARCREVQAGPDGFLDLWAREHYKSTIITVALTIQEILKNPDITVGIFSHSRPVAKSFLRQIKREFESNRVLQTLFPHIQPPAKGEKRTWSEDDGLIVRRGGNPKEATVEAWGLVDGQPIGKHFSLLIYDDVVTPESVTTPEMIAKTTDMWRMSLNLGARGGKVRMIGTRYHAADTYSVILKQKSANPRIYPATVDGTFDGEPVFFSRELLAEKRRDMGPFVFACQMLQNPLADKAQGFRQDWFRVYHRAEGGKPLPVRHMNRYILVDSAGEKKKGSDYTVMWVVGLAPDRNYYILDGVRDRLNLTERTFHLFRLHRLWLPVSVGYEKYGQQADIEHIKSRMSEETYHFTIIPLGGPMPKNDRIRRLVPLFETGRVYFPYRLLRPDCEGVTRDLADDFLNDEFLMFPVAAHDDMLDALSRIVEPELGAAFPRQPGNLVSGNPPLRAATDYNPAVYGAQDSGGRAWA